MTPDNRPRPETAPATGTAQADSDVAAPGRHPEDAPLPGGVHIPLITPFTADGARVDTGALERLAHEMADAGAAGLVALGTTAEAASLEAHERRTVAQVCARVCRARGIALTVGVGTNDTRKAAAELAAVPALADLERSGHGGVRVAALVTVPYFTRPSQDGVVAHMRHLAAGSPVPLVVYHIPYRTGRALSADTLRTLASIPGVVGVKHAVGGIDQDTVELLADRSLDGRFAVLAGDDVFCSPLLALGAAGAILASAHLATESFVELAAAWRRGDVRRARGMGHRLAGLSAALFAEPNPVVVKGVLHALGRVPSAAVRLPLLPAAPASIAAALTVLETATREAPQAVDIRVPVPGWTQTQVSDSAGGVSGAATSAVRDPSSR